MKLTKYKIFCVTENSWKEWYLPEAAAPPTTCPDSSSHSVDVTKTAVIEKEQSTEVVTQFEKNDKDLKLCSVTAQVDSVTGIAVVELPCPSSGRWMDAGVSFFTAEEPRRISMVEGVASFDLPADALFTGSPPMPAGTPLKTYHDDEMPEINQGWRIPAKGDYGPVGELEIDTMAGYGWVPGIITLRFTGKLPGTAPFSGWFTVNLKWGKNG